MRVFAELSHVRVRPAAPGGIEDISQAFDSRCTGASLMPMTTAGLKVIRLISIAHANPLTSCHENKLVQCGRSMEVQEDE